MIKAIVFDFDGVLVNTVTLNRIATKHACEVNCINLDDATYDKFFLGRRLEDGFGEYLATIGRISELEEFLND